MIPRMVGGDIKQRILMRFIVPCLTVATILVTQAETRVDWMIDLPEPATDIEVCQDGSWMVLAVPTGIEIRSTDDGDLIDKFDLPVAPRIIALSRDDEIAWVAYNAWRRIGPLVGGAIIYHPEEETDFTHTPLVSDSIVPQFTVAFVEDFVLTGSETDALEVWSATSGQHLRTVSQENASTNGGIAYSQEQGLVVFGGGSRGSATSAGVWNVSAFQLQTPIQTSNTYGLGSVAISPSGSLAITGADQHALGNRFGMVEAWNLPKGSLQFSIPVQSEKFRFSNDGRLLVSLSFVDPPKSSTSRVDFWDATNGNRVSSVESLSILALHFEDMAFSATDRHLFLTATRGTNKQEQIGRLIALTTPIIVNPVEIKDPWTLISWSGGLGPYVVEVKNSLKERWYRLGETTGHSWTARLPNSQAFYRVRSLNP